ncbi:MAG TPA: phage tail tube protein [Pseudolabrys sp.]|nr:phage tail tube protein [Pseudolabrys sp.]
MAKEKGRLLLFKIGNAGEYDNLCGLKTRSFNLSANEVDTTTPDCENPGGPVQKTAEPGIVNRSFAGSGTFISGEVAARLMSHVRAGSIFDGQAVVPGDGTYTGPWMVSDFEYSGEMEGTLEFSGTFTAAGPLIFTPEAGAPANTLLPSIAGIAQEGQTLTVRTGTWSGSPVFTYQWKLDGANIAGATSQTYEVVVGDVGKTITVAVTGTNSSGNVTVSSGGTADVIAA